MKAKTNKILLSIVIASLVFLGFPEDFSVPPVAAEAKTVAIVERQHIELVVTEPYIIPEDLGVVKFNHCAFELDFHGPEKNVAQNALRLNPNLSASCVELSLGSVPKPRTLSVRQSRDPRTVAVQSEPKDDRIGQYAVNSSKARSSIYLGNNSKPTTSPHLLNDFSKQSLIKGEKSGKAKSPPLVSKGQLEVLRC